MKGISLALPNREKESSFFQTEMCLKDSFPKGSRKKKVDTRGNAE